MSNREFDARERIALIGKSIFERGLTHGSTGNISVRLDGCWLITPTNSCLGRLDPARVSKLAWDGTLLDGDKPSKEAFMHLAMYEQRAEMNAVVHLHSTHSVAVSVLEDIDQDDVLPPLTAYYLMRVGRLPLVPYFPPGEKSLAEAVRSYVSRHHALLLANHGPLLGASSLDAASDAVEELEETARLYLMLQGRKLRALTPTQCDHLREKYGMP